MMALAAGSVSSRAEDAAADAAAQPNYPLAVAADGDDLYVVDLDLPGVWKVQGDQREVFAQGTKQLRTPLNRPRCVAIHPQGGILVGDSATREVYHIASSDAEPIALSGAKIGIPMAIAVSADGQTIYVGDAESRSVLRMPIGGGEPEVVVAVNARGLAFDNDGALWAVTPNDAAIERIDVDAGTSVAVVSGRPFQYPNGLTWVGDHGLVTDGYGSSIWKFSADGKTELWFQGPPLMGPVGISAGESAVWVADPKTQQVYEFDKDTKEQKTRL